MEGAYTMRLEKRVELLPPFCPLHKDEDGNHIPAPCLFCLVPEVYDIVYSTGDHEREIIYFTASDENSN